MGIAGQVAQDGIRTGKRAFGIDHPVDLPQRCQPHGKGGGVGQSGVVAEELQLTLAMGLRQTLKETPAEQPGEYPDRQKEPTATVDPTLTIQRQTAAGHDAVDVWMMRQRRSPGV